MAPAGEKIVTSHIEERTLVGRTSELDKLLGLLQPVSRTATSSSLALIEGDAGIGKTRLLNEFLLRAEREGYRVVRGHCYGVQETGPYFPFFQALSQLQAASLISARVSLKSVFPQDQFGMFEAVDAIAANRRAQFLRSLSEAIAEAVDATPTVIAVEDIQWADVSSLLFLNDLADLKDPALTIVCTARPHEVQETAVRQLIGRLEEKGQQIELGGLSRQELAQLIATLEGIPLLAEKELQLLHSFTAGNPMLARELLIHLKEHGLLNNHMMKEAIRRSATPRRLAGVIELRLASISGEARVAIEAAAIVGNDFEPSVVARVAQMSEHHVADLLEHAVEVGLLERMSVIGRSQYQFRHPMFRSGVYDGISPSRRSELHWRVADALSRTEASTSVDELAHHFALGYGSAAGEGGIKTCREAAERAERLLAYEDAATYWELALRCSPQSDVGRADILSRLGWCLWAARKWNAASEVWEQAIPLLEQRGDTVRAGKLALALADMHRWRNELDAAQAWVDFALEQSTCDLRDSARATAILGHIHCSRDNPGVGVPLLERAREIASQFGGDPLLTFWMAYGYLINGEPDRAYQTAKEGLAEAEELRRPDAIAFLAGSLVFHELSRLNPDAARRYVRVAEESVIAMDTPALSRLFVCKSLLLAYGGAWHDVTGECRRWMSEVRLAGKFQLATARVILAESYFALGDAQRAEQELMLALPDLAEMRVLASLHLARVLVRRGNSAEATLLVRQFAEQGMSQPRHASPRAFLGDIVAELDEPELWRRCYDRIAQESRPLLVVYTPISVQRVLGRLASRLKNWPLAIEHFECAVKQLSQGKAQWELAQTYRDYAAMRRARQRRGDTTKAATLELKACNILTTLQIPCVEPSRKRPDDNVFGLTGREIEVLNVLATGRRNAEIAETLGITIGTVQRHLENMFDKMEVASRTEAVSLALQHGLVGPPGGKP